MEVIVAMAIIVVLIASISMLFNPVSRMINDLSRDAYADVVMNDVCRYIRGKIDTANSVLIKQMPKGDDKEIVEFLSKSATDGSFDENIKCLFIASSGEKVRFYDFTESDGKSGLAHLAGDISGVAYFELRDFIHDYPKEHEPYRIFNEGYYSRNNFKIYFESTSYSGEIWITITIRAYNDRVASGGVAYGEKVTQDKKMTFKLLNAKSLSLDKDMFRPPPNDDSAYNLTPVVILYK